MGIKVNLYIHANEKITCTYFENVITITTFLIIMFILRVSKSHPWMWHKMQVYRFSIKSLMIFCHLWIKFFFSHCLFAILYRPFIIVIKWQITPGNIDHDDPPALFLFVFCVLGWIFQFSIVCVLQVKDIYLHPDPFSIQNGLLTPTLKSKRPQLKKYFKPQLDDLYSKLH